MLFLNLLLTVVVSTLLQGKFLSIVWNVKFTKIFNLPELSFVQASCFLLVVAMVQGFGNW